MKAIVVRQPWATLIALGVKVIETRPSPPNGPMRPEGVRGLPGCSLERGERIAVVAGGHLPPNDAIQLGWEWTVGISTVGPARHADAPGGMDCDCDDPDEGAWSSECRALNEWVPALLHDEGAHGWSIHAPLPLGAVVCTVTVDDALPIVSLIGAAMGSIWRTTPNTVGGPDQLFGAWRPEHATGAAEVLTDQLPLGDFTPGRWGWLLSDPQPCDPIPYKGRQGVFELPADVAEALR